MWTEVVHRSGSIQNYQDWDMQLIHAVTILTITAEIFARSLANFYHQYADRHMNLKFVRRVSERERAIRPFIYRKKQIDVSF